MIIIDPVFFLNFQYLFVFLSLDYILSHTVKDC